MTRKKRINKEVLSIQKIIRIIFPTIYSLDNKGKRTSLAHVEVNTRAIKHRMMLTEIAQDYDGSNFNDITSRIRNKARTIQRTTNN